MVRAVYLDEKKNFVSIFAATLCIVYSVGKILHLRYYTFVKTLTIFFLHHHLKPW